MHCIALHCVALHCVALHYNCNYHCIVLHDTTQQLQLHYFTLQYTRLDYTQYITLQCTTIHYTNYTSPLQLQLRYPNYTSLQLQLTTSTPLQYNYNYTYCNYNCATPHYTQQLWWGDHCNHCSHSRKHNSNHLSVHQWIRSAIHESQQPTLPIGFLFLKVLLPPCAALLVIIMENPSPALTSETFIWKASTALPSAQRWQPWCAAKIGVEFGTKIISLGNRQIKLQPNSQVVANQVSIGNQWFGVPIL